MPPKMPVVESLKQFRKLIVLIERVDGIKNDQSNRCQAKMNFRAKEDQNERNAGKNNRLEIRLTKIALDINGIVVRNSANLK